MWKKVLFLHDFSDDTAAGLSWAVHALLPRNSTLLLVHIVNPILGSETPEKVRLAREELERIADDLNIPLGFSSPWSLFRELSVQSSCLSICSLLRTS